MDAYKKEVWFTVIMSIILLVSGHFRYHFLYFPVEGTLGFPITYIVPILVGWFGVLFLTIISGMIGNHIDDAIEQSSAKAS
ncbi:hypothetical protein KHA80_04295 [Anaerobacillus sp. HL2]|nr:hypothetical protein KHA80_04295 [Anaerobacillus sp. HL2]